MRTGDVMRVDENGNFWVTDRLKEVYVERRGSSISTAMLTSRIADQIQRLPSPTIRAGGPSPAASIRRRRSSDIDIFGRTGDRTPHCICHPLSRARFVQPRPETKGPGRHPRLVRQPGGRVQETARRCVGTPEPAQNAEWQDPPQGPPVPETGGETGEVVNRWWICGVDLFISLGWSIWEGWRGHFRYQVCMY